MASSPTRLTHRFRVLVDKGDVCTPAKFAQCLWKELHPEEVEEKTDLHQPHFVASAELVGNELIVKRDENGVCFGHSSTCPADIFNHEEDLPEPEQEVRVGIAIILENAQGQVLLTRRSNHLRSFGGAWVVPGGHLESGETLEEAGARELKEETGIEIDKNSLKKLALWESVFPPYIEVLYLFGRTSHRGFDALSLQPAEVSEAAWLSKEQIVQLLSDEAEAGKQFTAVQCPRHNKENLDWHAIVEGGALPRTLFSIKEESYRVTLGTRFALRVWSKNVVCETDIVERTQSSATISTNERADHKDEEHENKRPRL